MLPWPEISAPLTTTMAATAAAAGTGLIPLRIPRSRSFSPPRSAWLRCSAASVPRVPKLVGMGSKLVGCGSAVPNLIVSNDDLARIVDTSDEWISVRTGIRNRRVLTGNETLNGLATEAAKGALQMAQVEAENVDLVIMCSSTPDDLFGGGTGIQATEMRQGSAYSATWKRAREGCTESSTHLDHDMRDDISV